MRKPSKRSSRPVRREPPTPTPPEIPTHTCEADVAEGLEGVAVQELIAQAGDRVEIAGQSAKPGLVQFRYTGNLFHLLRLKTVQTVYLLRTFDIPRPKALLGDQHFKALLAMIAAVRDLSPANAYRTFHLSAAGSESSVMKRLKDELAARTGLLPTAAEGDLLLRLRHPIGSDQGWDVLVRLSPRPLATRPWRVCNREGALNATVAHAMALLTDPQPDDVFLNIACGSGTLLIERLAAGPLHSATGYDSDADALDCARRNAEAAGYGETIRLHLGDARALPLPGKSVDVIAADLPFGHLVGSHQDNLRLYPDILHEAARVAKPGARFVLISHEVKLLEALLSDSREWATEQSIRVALGGLYPRIFLLSRK